MEIETTTSLLDTLRMQKQQPPPVNMNSHIGDIDISDHDPMKILQEQESVTETCATSCGSDSNSSGSNRSDDSSEESNGEVNVLELEVAELAEEREEELQGAVDEDLQGEQAEEEEVSQPIKNSAGMTIGFKKIKIRKNPLAKNLTKLTRRLGGSSRSSGKKNNKNSELTALVEVPKILLKQKQEETKQALLMEPQEVSPTNQYSKSQEASAAIMPNNHFSDIVLTSVLADIGMAAAEAEAQANGWDVTICICDTTGIPLQVKRNTSMKGSAASFDMAVEKAKMAATFGKVTGRKIDAETSSDGDRALIAVYPFLHIGGGVPMVLNGNCCGAVGVSNGQVEDNDQEQDQQVASAAVKAMADIYWSYQVLANGEV